MTTLTISIIVVFVLGYALIATESLTKVNKAAIALLMLVGCWTLYMMDPMQYLQLMHPDYLLRTVWASVRFMLPTTRFMSTASPSSSTV